MLLAAAQQITEGQDFAGLVTGQRQAVIVMGVGDVRGCSKALLALVGV